jgi:hypothetical protein
MRCLEAYGLAANKVCFLTYLLPVLLLLLQVTSCSLMRSRLL